MHHRAYLLGTACQPTASGLEKGHLSCPGYSARVPSVLRTQVDQPAGVIACDEMCPYHQARRRAKRQGQWAWTAVAEEVDGNRWAHLV